MQDAVGNTKGHGSSMAFGLPRGIPVQGLALRCRALRNVTCTSQRRVVSGISGKREPKSVRSRPPASVAMVAMDTADAVLRKRFGFGGFRNGQREVISRLLNPPENQPPRAVAVFPTGAGKSLTYQLPAVCFSEGLTLVVSPLLALMRDQTKSLLEKDIAAASLDSTLNAAETRELFENIEAGQIRLLFVAPERFKNERFIRAIKRAKVSLFVIDEAHCISEWGHSFRPDYLRLARFADELGFQRRLALTATATPQVAEDIARSLSIPYPDGLVRTPHERPNLSLRFTHVPSCYDGTMKSIGASVSRRVEILAGRIKERAPGPTLVYVTLQATAMQVAEQLSQMGIEKVRPFHAGMRTDEKQAVQDWFMSSGPAEQAVVVATIAFGMGVDKSDIRYVYHLNLPKSIESYVQEIGRAGRNGQPSVCEVLACIDDIPMLEGFALGATPTRSSIEGLVRDLFEGKSAGDETDIGVYDASMEHDIRDLVINQMLAQLDLQGGYIREITPWYTELRCRRVDKKTYDEVIATGSTAAQILAEGRGSGVIRTIDVRHVVEKLNLEYARISRELDDLVNDGKLVKVEPYKLRNRFRIQKVPEPLSDAVDMLHNAAVEMQNRERERLSEVIDLISASSCQTRLLSKRFGDNVALEDPCGHCQVCEAGGKQAVAFDQDQRARVGRTLDVERWSTLIAQDGLPKDNPVLLARFAAGISSPFIGKRYRKLPGFGSMADHAFETLLEAAECVAVDAKP